MSPQDVAAAFLEHGQNAPVDLKGAVRSLCQAYSTEITPASALKIPSFSDLLPAGTDVYITFLPGSDYRDTVALAVRLRKEGFNPVPHFAARSIDNKAALDDYLSRAVGEANVSQVLIIAGAPSKPCGEFADSMQLMNTGLFEKHGIKSIGVAGHPENCNCCTDKALYDALHWKNKYAENSSAKLQIVTQFAFEAGPFIAYDQMLRREGVTLPLHVGVPGIASLKTLISYAMSCGVGNSINFLKRQAQNVSKLLLPSAPDKLIVDLARHRMAEPQSQIAKLHFFTLGGLAKSAKWVNAISAGRFELSADKTGLVVDER